MVRLVCVVRVAVEARAVRVEEGRSVAIASTPSREVENQTPRHGPSGACQSLAIMDTQRSCKSNDDG